MTRLGLTGGAAALLWFVFSPLACGGDAFTVGSGGDDGGSSSGTASSSGVDGSGSSSGGSSSGGDDGGTDGTLGDATHTDGPPPADAPQEAPPGSIVYVSNTSGNDANDGTDPSKPKKTIAAAFTRAQSITSSAEVHVCKGVYAEKGLSLSQTLKLLGAYDCSTWHRTANYGFPTFDGVNNTVIQNADPSAQPATLLVTGGVAPSALIDGFTVQGAASFNGTTVAIETLPSASPVLQNDVFQGGGGTGVSSTAGSGKPGSIGVGIGGGSPEVTLCVVSGGTGSGNIGSTGIAIASTGTPYVHDVLVSGGSGTAAVSPSDTASVGILVTSSMAQSQALKNLYVVANDDNASSAGPTIGIDVAAVGGTPINVDIQGSAIRGGAGTGGNSYSTGVVVDDVGGTVRVLGSRVYGGSRTGSGPTYDIFAEGAGTLDVHNSEIHAGTTSGTAGGVVLVAASNTSIVDDTIYTGAGGGAAINVEANVSGVVISDDLLLGSNSQSAVGVIVPACQSGQIKRLDYMAFVNLGTLYQCGSTQATTVATMAAALPGVSTAGDFQVGSGATCLPPTCIPDPACPGAPTACIPTILGASWSPNDDGVAGLFNGAPSSVADAGGSFKGWSLPQPNTLCAIARGGTPYAGIATDIFGQLRDGSKPTIGAFEYTPGKCQ